MTSGPPNGCQSVGYTSIRGRFVSLLRIYGGWHDGYPFTILAGIGAQEFITRTYAVTPLADVFHLRMPLEASNQRVFFTGVGKPDCIIEVINYPFAQEACDNEFYYGRPKRTRLSMDEHIVSPWSSPKQQGETTNEASDNERELLKGMPRRIQDTPSTGCEKGSKVYSELVLLEDRQVLLKPEALGGSNTDWVWT